MRKISIVLLTLFSVTAHAQNGIELVKKYYPMSAAVKVDEFVVQSAAYKLTPIGTNIDEVFRLTNNAGLGFHNHCFPDRTPLACQFRSSDSAGQEANYSVEYSFDGQSRLKKILVARWYSARARRYTTDDRRPGVSTGVYLESGLGVGKNLGDFEKVYGNWLVTEVPEDGWPITIEFIDKTVPTRIQKNGPLLVGLEIGTMSSGELQKLKNDRGKLLNTKVGAAW